MRVIVPRWRVGQHCCLTCSVFTQLASSLHSVRSIFDVFAALHLPCLTFLSLSGIFVVQGLMRRSDASRGRAS